LAALTKVPNPLGAEEEAEQYGKTPHKIGVHLNKITSRPDLGSESHQIGCFTIG